MAVIEISNVWKRFGSHASRPSTLKEALVRMLRPQKDAAAREDRNFYALKDVSFTIERGETFGIIGTNGSGKSTLLKLITGISKPTRGHVGINGRVSALLELGAGFHPDFSGRENTYLNGAILGLKRHEVEAKFDSIVDFAEIGAFIDNPVKTYSSGMYMRLAFSIAVHVDPDILVIDEVLAVGDAAFQQKCFDQIMRFKHAGKTIVFVSHSEQAVLDLCQRAAWIEKGELRAMGKTSDVLEAYSGQVTTAIESQREAGAVAKWAGSAQLSNVRGMNAEGTETGNFHLGEEVRFAFDVTASNPAELDLIVRIYRTDRICCYDAKRPLHELTADHTEGALGFRIPSLILHGGPYHLQLNLVARDGDLPVDEKHFNFFVESRLQGLGIAPLTAEWDWQPVATVS